MPRKRQRDIAAVGLAALAAVAVLPPADDGRQVAPRRGRQTTLWPTEITGPSSSSACAGDKPRECAPKDSERNAGDDDDTRGSTSPAPMAGAAKRKRGKREELTGTVEPRSSATLAYYFPHGSAVNGLIKLLNLVDPEGNLQFGPEGITFNRSDAKMRMLVFVKLPNARCLVKGTFNNGQQPFYFGLKLHKMVTVCTHSLGKHDSFMIYFERSNATMHTEQINARSGARTVSTLHSEDVHEFVFSDWLSESCEPNMIIAADAFWAWCSQITTAKCPRLLLYYSGEGMCLCGLDASGGDVKRVFLSATGTGTMLDELAMQSITSAASRRISIDMRMLKTLLATKHTTLPHHLVRVYFEDGAVRFVANVALVGEIQILVREDADGLARPT